MSETFLKMNTRKNDFILFKTKLIDDLHEVVMTELLRHKNFDVNIIYCLIMMPSQKIDL